MNDLPSRALKNPSNSSISAAKTGAAISLAYSWIFGVLGAAFVMGTPLVMFTPLGQDEIAGMSFTHIVLNIGNFAVIAALIYAAVADPIRILCKKILCYQLLYESYCKLKSNTIYADETEALKYETGFYQHVLGIKYSCMAVSSVLAAIIGYVCYGPLLNAVSAPWSDLLTLVVIATLYPLFSTVTFFLATKSYKQENPELYNAAINADSN